MIQTEQDNTGSKKMIKEKYIYLQSSLLAMLAGGHILIDDVPGVGKTTLAVAFSQAMQLENHRVQFTPDVLPADILGFSMYQKETGQFVYYPGAVICNLFFGMMRLTGRVRRRSRRFWKLWRKGASPWTESHGKCRSHFWSWRRRTRRAAPVRSFYRNPSWIDS